MHIALWIVTALVALVFLIAGLLKLVWSKGQLATRLGWHWVDDLPLTTIRTVGLLEVLGAAGLLLPRVTRVLPWLSAAAAAGLILTVLAGAVVHLRRKESIVPNIVLAVLSAVALYGAVQAN